MKKLTIEQVQSVDGLSHRQAGKILGVGKSTVGDARRAIANGTFEQPLPDGSVTIDLSGSAVPRTKEQIEAALTARGVDVSAVDVTQRFGEWGAPGEEPSATWRATVTPKRGLKQVIPIDVDPVELLKSMRDEYVPELLVRDSDGEECVFVFSINDSQFGKAEGGGTPATLKRYEKAIAGAIARIVQLQDMGFNITTLVIIGGGDIIEGCTIYPNQSFSLDLDRRGQINTAVATIMNVIDRLAPYFVDIKVLACKGNHGENRINGKKNNAHDNDDVLVFEMAKIAYDRDPVIGPMIEWVIADDHIGVTLKAAGWVLGTTHGDELGAGRFPFQKVFESMKRWALGRMPMGKCDVIVTHHFHHEQSANFGAWEWMQTRAMDGGSKWFEQVTGMYSDTGVLTFVMTPSKRVTEVLYV